MKDLWNTGILQRILILLILIIFLGISPLPHEVRTGFERGRRAMDFNTPAKAAENLVEVAEKLPWRSDLWEQAGHLALEGGDFQAAITYFERAAASGALSFDGYLSFGDAYTQLGNDPYAIQIWEEAEKIFGTSLETTLRLAETHRKNKDYPALIENLKTLIELRPSESGLYNELGFLLAAYGPDSAPPYLIQASDLNPAWSDARELSFAIQRALPNENPTYTLMASGQKLADLGEWELAALAFRHAVERQPDYAESWAYLGEALQHLETPLNENALATLEKALTLDPQSLPANTFLALYWQRQGNPELSLAYITAAAELDPRNPNLLVDLGAATARLGDLETAESYYQNAVEITSGEPFYINQLVEFYLRYNLEVHEKALPLARQTLLLHPNEPTSLDSLGQVLFRLDDLLNAERFFIKAILLQPVYAPAHLHLGVLYNLEEKHSLAKYHLSQAIALGSGTATADHAQRILDGYTDP
jgi:tetratricopeptide (TPR) repeat protein